MSFALVVTKAVVKFDARGLNADGTPIYHIPVATNQAACNVQGFFFVLGGTLSPFYNCALSVYYLYVIKFNYSETKIKKKVEPCLHAVPWAWALFSAIYALASKSINPNPANCAVNAAPFDCTDIDGIDCERGAYSTTLRWVFQGAPFLTIFFAICVIMVVVYFTVWKQERRMKRYDHRATMIAGRQTEVSLRVPNSRKVLNQALAFAGAFLCSFILVYTNGFIFLGSGKYNITIFALQAFFHPLQGKTD